MNRIVRAFWILKPSPFTLKAVVVFSSDTSVISTRLHDVIYFHSHAFGLTIEAG
jgi:hypothetical protein